MTITQLKYFVSLAESLNFSQVASQYFVAQTAISYNIKSLESELNVKLFDRTTKKTTLTDAGRIFYNRVKVAVSIIDLAQQEVTDRTVKSSLSIGSSRLTSGRTLYDTVNRFQAAHPEVDVVLTADEPELGLFDKLVNGRIDLAVYVCAPFVKQPEGSATKEFFMDLPRRFIVSTRHPFSRHKDGISPDLFKNERKISYASKLEEYQALTPSAAENSAASAEPLTVSDFNSLLDMIGANLGVACLPMLDDLSTESVRTVPCLEELPPEHFLSVSATYMQPNNSPLIQRFINDFFQTLSARSQQGRP